MRNKKLAEKKVIGQNERKFVQMCVSAMGYRVADLMDKLDCSVRWREDNFCFLTVKTEEDYQTVRNAYEKDKAEFDKYGRHNVNRWIEELN